MDEDEHGAPVKKPTKFLTNSSEMVKQLCQRCVGRGGACSRPQDGEHRQCRGKGARMAAVCAFKLCRAILVGFRNQLRVDGKYQYQDGSVGILESFSREQEDFDHYRLSDSSGAILHVRIS